MCLNMMVDACTYIIYVHVCISTEYGQDHLIEKAIDIYCVYSLCVYFAACRCLGCSLPSAVNGKGAVQMEQQLHAWWVLKKNHST